MSTSNHQSVQSIPNGMHTVTPHLVCRGAAEAIAWYVKAFGAVENGSMPGPDGKLVHAQITIGDSPIMLVDENPQWGAIGPASLNGSPVSLHVYVEDVDDAFQRAVEAGAHPNLPPTDMFWGDRYSTVTDPFGHRWSLATHIRDVSPDEAAQAMAAVAGDA